MKYKNSLFYIILGMFSACAEREEFPFGQLDSRAEGIEVIPLSSMTTMVSDISGLSTYFTAEAVEEGKDFQFKEGSFLDLSNWVTVWTDSNGKRWELREEFDAGTSYSLLVGNTLKTEDGYDMSLFRYTGLTFTTPEEYTCPYIDEVECELVDYCRIEQLYGRDEYSTVVKLNLPKTIALPNGDFLMPNDLYMEAYQNASIHSYQKYNMYDYWEEDGYAYLCFPMLEKKKYEFELRGDLSLRSDNESYGEHVGCFVIKIKNILDLTNVQ